MVAMLIGRLRYRVGLSSLVVQPLAALGGLGPVTEPARADAFRGGLHRGLRRRASI